MKQTLHICKMFLKDAFGIIFFNGSKKYYIWMILLSLTVIAGLFSYIHQLRFGLSVTGMHDHVSWGLYISNFTFLVGLAAAAVMLMLPAYVMKDIDFSRAVLIGEGVAVSALIMCLMFVVADMGRPDRLWHMIPGPGYFNWPSSMLTWDVFVLNGYLALNTLVPLYILLCHYTGRKPDKGKYIPFMFLSVLWAFGIHLVTAFLYAGLPARPFWNTALLGPRFLASAFAAGPAFIIIILSLLRQLKLYPVNTGAIQKLALIVTVAAQINLVMLGSELFTEFYHPTGHTHSATYLFFGLHGKSGLMLWIWPAIIVNICCTIALSIHPLRKNFNVLIPLCGLLFIAIWIEKGMGLIIPGFIPSPLEEIREYSPSFFEWGVTAGIWAAGLMIQTVLIKIALPLLKGTLKYQPPGPNSQK